MIRSMGAPFMVRDALRPLENNFKYRVEIKKPYADLYDRGCFGLECDRDKFRRAYDAADEMFLNGFEDDLEDVIFSYEYEVKDSPKSIKVLFNEESDLLRFVNIFDRDIEEVLIANEINNLYQIN